MGAGGVGWMGKVKEAETIDAGTKGERWIQDNSFHNMEYHFFLNILFLGAYSKSSYLIVYYLLLTILMLEHTLSDSPTD